MGVGIKSNCSISMHAIKCKEEEKKAEEGVCSARSV